MPLAALISAGVPAVDGGGAVSAVDGGAGVSAASGGRGLRATLHFAGQTLIEYQARQAHAAGASPIVVMVGAVVPMLSRAIDNLGRDGIELVLARDILTLRRQLPADHDVLLVADGMVVAQPLFDSLAATAAPAVLVTADSATSAALERVDANFRWGGLVKLAPAQIFDTLDMIGDWDLQSTLLRRAIQSGAVRVAAPDTAMVDGLIAIADSQKTADAIAEATLAAHAVQHGDVGPVERYILGPAAGLFAPWLMRQHVPDSQMEIGAIAAAVIGLLAVELNWKGIALPLFLLACLLSMIASRLRAIARRASGHGKLPWIRPALTLLGIALIGGMTVEIKVSGWMGGVYLGLMLGLVEWAIDAGRAEGARNLPLCTIGTAVTLLLPFQLLGLVHIGLALAILYAMASLTVITAGPRQN